MPLRGVIRNLAHGRRIRFRLRAMMIKYLCKNINKACSYELGAGFSKIPLAIPFVNYGRSPGGISTG